MELNDIYSLWDRFERSDVKEMALDLPDGSSFRLTRGEAGALAAKPVTAEGSVTAAVPVTENTAPQEEKEDGKDVLRSPLAGTFYVSPSPDADAYVTLGQTVHKGDVVGIVEAMKLFNEIHAHRDGILQELLVEDGQFVEYSQPLMKIS